MEKMSFEQSSSEGEEGVSNVSHVMSILDKGNNKCEVHMEDAKETSCGFWPQNFIRLIHANN